MDSADMPIVLQPAVEFPPVRGSIFDDPGDEKSWRVSQRAVGVNCRFAGREPSWYETAIRPLRGVDSVLDLGCGPGLTLEALRTQGSTRVLGIDRWFAFVERARPEMPIVAHDLTLPMPFLESGSFEGVFSHYALEYMSPIGLRQVLREAHRVLRSGGKLVVYMAGTGLGGADFARTVPYRPDALRRLLAEAGFEAAKIEAPGGRNLVVSARRPDVASTPRRCAGEAYAALTGDMQLSAAFPLGGDRVVLELAGANRGAKLAFDLPPGASEQRVSVCVRVLALRPRGAELRTWVWVGMAPVVSECSRLEFLPAEMRVRCAGPVEHCSVWAPSELSLDPSGDAYAPIDGIAAAELSEVERAVEGRKVFVERPGNERVDAAWALGDGRNRFLIRRAQNLAISDLDSEWADSRCHGIALSVAELERSGAGRELLLWARWRQAPVFVDGGPWDRLFAAVSARSAELTGPVALVDPALGAGLPAGRLPGEAVEAAGSTPGIYVILSGASRDASSSEDLERLRGRLLHGGPRGESGDGMREADESLRYLTERILLFQLRQWKHFSWAEVGRRRRWT